MNGQVGFWSAGIVGSVLAHGAVLVCLAIAIQPDPIVKQTAPSSQLEVEAYQLDRTKAREKKPDSHTTDALDASGAPIDAGAVAQSKAKAAQVPVDHALPSALPRADRLAATAAPAEPVNPSVVSAASLAATSRGEPVIKAAKPAAGALLQAVIRTETPLPTADPTPSVATKLDAGATRLASAALHSQTAPSQSPAAIPAAVTPVAGHKLKAALAFSGAETGNIDPVSLAAFQSFTQPGDIQTQTGRLRDGISALLAQVPCSRLQVGFDPDTATLQVNGHIPEGDLRAPVLAALQSQMGADIQVSDNMLILPRPQCGALTGIGAVGLPQSTDQITNPLLIGEDTHARVLDFVRDDRLFFDLTAPDYDAYIYVDYFDAGGNVLHLSPNDQTPLRVSLAQSVFRVGAKQTGDTGLQIFIGPPYGQEIAVGFAASEPLYDGLRPIIEPAAPYLDWLKTRVAQAREQHDDFKGEWVYFFVTTADK